MTYEEIKNIDPDAFMWVVYIAAIILMLCH